MAIHIDGKTKLCALLGNPVEHTLSPAIHNFLADQLGIPLVYVAFGVERAELEDAVRGGLALGILGFNVTVPFKQSVMSCLTGLEDGARAIGAVNTLVRSDQGFCGYNTDWIGLKRLLFHADISLQGRTVVLLGAGGAAWAAAYVCGCEKAEKLYILNRTREKAVVLAERMHTQFPSMECCALEMNEWTKMEESGLIALQATSVGLWPHTDCAPIEDVKFYQRLDAAVDMIYKPEETLFMRLAADAGAKTANGLNMLLYQAVAAFELWVGRKVEPSVVSRAKDMLKQEIGFQRNE
ncbi:MAG: shikimate dehydrogenase [Lachnospiraceae bacterium]